jgi:hypothetical protein
MESESLAIDVAKWLLNSAVAMKTAQLAADTVADYTRFEKDSLAVRLGSGAIGMVVARKLEPATDAIVDKTADFIVEKRNKFRSRKNNNKKD